MLNITIRNGAFLFMMTTSYLKCFYWRVFRLVCHGNVFLNKREAFREAFDNFDLEKICNYDANKLEELRNNPGIIRNKLKISATVKNAKAFKNIIAEFGSFDKYIWGFTNYKIIYEYDKTTSDLSDTISKDLKKRGMSFVGSTIIYSYLQAVGIINSHEPQCFLYNVM